MKKWVKTQRTAIRYRANDGQNPLVKFTMMAAAKEMIPISRRYLMKKL
jgi:hypothetical protein